ncbi:response regulator [Schlegelella sp. S2-27]|uniref:histidine kinase n=1 Tax=Caldimonas mangrovi TaxID=2944811 RepID=A0ABT0YUZ0_9BURK|nr:response regulator [Caldimonas mangrovi]MCM5682568.1 response regulator [Caldimonas mangrovi]
MPPRHTPSHLLIHTLIATLTVLIFAVDLVTRLGFAEWVLYLLPVGLCVLQSRPSVPLVAATAASLLIVVGFFFSPPSGSSVQVMVNRAMGMFAIWTTAILVCQVLRGRLQVQRQLWLQQGEAALSQSVVGEQTLMDLGQAVCATLARFAGATVAVLHRLEGQLLHPTGSYSLAAATEGLAPLRVGDGVAGQVARDGQPQWLQGLPPDYLRISSSLGSAAPVAVLAAPVSVDGRTCGVIELGFTGTPVHAQAVRDLAAQVAETIGVALRSAAYRQRLVELLEETQRQSEELQAQQEELRVSNEELEEQSRALQDSQARLEAQQSELEQTNVRLEEHTQRLERQRQDLLIAQQALQLNAEKLESASRHKSEFLANMSHELRTPLNSSLILSKLLADNRTGNLTAEQVKFAQSIHSANNDLLTLINDILDLSKIEAGHVEVNVERVAVADVLNRLRDVFAPMAEQKGLVWSTTVAPAVAETLLTDGQRLQQVLRNLLSNALKFTERGEVALQVSVPAPGRIAFSVHDTGVGIAPEQHDVVFEAFRQADGSTSRKYGGTGLGLSISRELAHLLGGEIRLQSTPGQGSVFMLELPVVLEPRAGAAAVPPAVPMQQPPAGPSLRTAPAPAASRPAPSREPAVQDDRDRLTRPDRLILAVEDDTRFAEVLYGLVRELNFDCVVASTGAEALELTQTLKPAGILLDMNLPDQSGLGVLEQLKRDPSTRHIPVHVVSLHDRSQTALELGAIGYAVKPVDRGELASAVRKIEGRLGRRRPSVLVIEDDASLRDSIRALLAATQAEITTAGTVRDALAQLSQRTFDCVVMDLALPDGSGYDVLEAMSRSTDYSFPPVIVYTGRALMPEEEQRLRRYSRSIIIKGARSPERLLDEVTLFLHSVESALPPDQRRLLEQARQRDSVLDGRTVLLVEDDVRNVFALSSVLEPLGVKLQIARNGREALTHLERLDGIDLVLMDLMMPEMDGLTAIRQLRANPALQHLPVIALTAKAMADDRLRCLEAGADDYIAKPIDVERLVSLCRVWVRK